MKKKNLLKVLALTGMLALSVGAVTSCGTQGATGPQGPKGEKGEKGDTGAQGEKGEKGDTGAQGPKGEKGETGAQGEKGETGAQGEKGETGAQGEKGETGAQGEKGADGLTPYIGANGNWWVGETDTGVKAQGPQGVSGGAASTFYPVVFLEDGSAEEQVVYGLNVTQDKYFIKNGESATIKFADDEGKAFEFVELMVNGEEVLICDGSSELTLTADENSVGWQVRVVSYGTLLDYGATLVLNEYKAMCKKDQSLLRLESDDSWKAKFGEATANFETYAGYKEAHKEMPFAEEEVNALRGSKKPKWMKDNDNKNISELMTAFATPETGGIESLLFDDTFTSTNYGKLTTVKKAEKVNACVEKFLTLIHTAYDETITFAKGLASNDALDYFFELDEDGEIETFADEKGITSITDATTHYNNVLTKISAAKTLSQIANGWILDSGALKVQSGLDAKGNPVYYANGNLLEEQRLACLDELESSEAFDAITGVEGDMVEILNEIKERVYLENIKVPEDAFGDELLETYYNKISAATTFKTTKVGEVNQFDLVIEFGKKYAECDKLLLTALKDHYRALWVDDIQKSTASSYQKSGAIRVIDDILDNVLELGDMFENDITVPSSVDTLDDDAHPAWELAELYLATKAPINNYRTAKYYKLFTDNLENTVEDILTHDAGYAKNITPKTNAQGQVTGYNADYVGEEFDVNKFAESIYSDFFGDDGATTPAVSEIWMVMNSCKDDLYDTYFEALNTYLTYLIGESTTSSGAAYAAIKAEFEDSISPEEMENVQNKVNTSLLNANASATFAVEDIYEDSILSCVQTFTQNWDAEHEEELSSEDVRTRTFALPTFADMDSVVDSAYALTLKAFNLFRSYVEFVDDLDSEGEALVGTDFGSCNIVIEEVVDSYELLMGSYDDDGVYVTKDTVDTTIANFENYYAESVSKAAGAIYTKITGWIAVTAVNGGASGSKAIKAYSVLNDHYAKAEFTSFEDISDFEEEVVDAIEDACGTPFTSESYFPTV